MAMTLSMWMSSPAAAQSASGCSATIDGVDLSTASTRSTALELDANSTVTVIARAPGPITSVNVRLLFGPFGVTVVNEAIRSNEASYTEVVEVADIARWGVGLYKVEANTTGTECSQTAYLKIVGRSALSTPVGLVALVLSVAGVAGLAGAAVAARRSLRAKPVLGGFGGGVAGLGLVVLAQQQGALALDVVVVVIAAVVLAVVGVVLTWLLAGRKKRSEDSTSRI
jgi:hypothetical protein